MDQNFLLTVEKLVLSETLQRGAATNGVFVIKNIPARTYLSVNEAQAAVLSVFKEPTSVPDALSELLVTRRCLPLREFYELIVKAYDAGILSSTRSRTPERAAMRWLTLGGSAVLWPAVVAVLTAGACLVLRGAPFSSGWPGWVVGALVSLVAWLAGRALAASFLAGAGVEVYAGKRHWGFVPAVLWPELDDCRLLPRRDRAVIALAEGLPITLCLLAALTWWKDEAAMVALIWLVVWRPWGAGLPRRIAGIFSRRPLLDTDWNFQFLTNQRPQRHWRSWAERWDVNVCAVELLVACGWALLLGRVVLPELGLSFREVMSDWSYWSLAAPVLVSALLGTVVLTMVRRWRDGIRQVWRVSRQRWSSTWRRWRQEPRFPETEAALLRLAAAHPLLGLLNPYEQAEVVRSWRPATFKAWKRLAASGTESDRVGLILSGTAKLWRRASSGRLTQGVRLDEGALFGLPKMKAGDDALPEVRSRTPVAAMMMPASVFRDVVIAKLGTDTAHDLTHKFAFLRQLPLCSHWHAHAVGRFARLAQFGAYADGEVILRWKSDPQWFYVVYEGVVQVRRRGKTVARLKAGEFFGEISLLQNSVATAEMVAQGPVRCLQIDRTRFLRFVTHNHHVALQLERISSQRLGEPIFPLDLVASPTEGLAMASAGR